MKREELGGIGKWSRRVKEMGKGQVWMVKRMGSKSVGREGVKEGRWSGFGEGRRRGYGERKRRGY